MNDTTWATVMIVSSLWNCFAGIALGWWARGQNDRVRKRIKLKKEARR